MFTRIFTTHSLQYLTTTGLHWQMNMFNQIAAFSQHFDQTVIKITRMGSCKANPRNINFVNIVHQISKGIIHVGKIFTVSIHILPKKCDLFKSLTG
ncbi:hypothetical protein D3C78_1461130 [compost metagenome]